MLYVIIKNFEKKKTIRIREKLRSTHHHDRVKIYRHL